MAWKAYALAAAIELARHEKRHEDESRYLAMGREVAKRAADLEQNPFIDFNLYILYRAIGEDDLGLQAVQRIAVYPGGWYTGVTSACLLRHEPDAAIKAFDEAMKNAKKDNAYYRLARGLLVPRETDGRLMTRELVEDSLDHSATIGRLQSLFALCLVSGPSEIKNDAVRAAEGSLPQAGSTGGVLSVSRCIEYLADQKSEADLLKESAEHGYSAVMAHCTIAMLSLARREHQKARDHFESAVATQTIGSLGYEWARACLARMENDRLWPHSISGQALES